MRSYVGRFWSKFFWAAALFNWLIGIPLMFASAWTFGIAYYDDPATAGMAINLWSDFGFCVTLIGVGYAIVAVDPRRNHGLVWLGICAKLFDVVVLSWRWYAGIARPIVLLPAAIDGAFVLGFMLFLLTIRKQAQAA
ncbi:hypothetical protein [Sinorhizobium prairiense]|uniref:hypothetical protein n=1 Tax=unclassified Sinorhizobium TaxID=2613772 RepID=UPI0023D7D4A1|nr:MULTISPECIES: hypothetical protein [unclassified Sinorhizobium]WEJ08447.1 hypothetical protein N0Q90_01780 [Sinorhizobium sp. M103]WEJ14048.1 hypothetical protein N0Q91_00930 [Sinorhizobium sp. K101]WEJ35649.1 hypothetical protein N0R80_00930 [Sinorhizobium sp. C101]